MDLEETRNPSKHHLYEKERKFLTGDLDSEKDREKANDARRTIIEDRLPGITDRFQYLVDDIVLLNMGDFLQPEHWTSGWEQLKEIEPRVGVGERDVWLPYTHLEGVVRLGFTIGHMSRCLVDGFQDRIDRNRLVWGFIMGFLGERRSRFPTELENVEEALDFISSELSKKEKWAVEHPETMGTEIVEEDISNSASLGGSQGTDKALQTALEQREKYRQSPEETDISKLLLFDSIIETSTEDIEQYQQLTRDLLRDTNLVKNTSYKKLEGVDVLREAWKADSTITRGTLGTELNAGQKIVSKLMNDFGEGGTNDRWSGRPKLVEEKPSSRSVDKKWSLTAYGELVGTSLFLENGVEIIFRGVGELITRGETDEELQETIEESLQELQDC